MTLKEIRKLKQLTQLQASLICNISLRTYKRLESDFKYQNSIKYKHATNLLKQYKCENSSCIDSKVITVVGLGYVGLSNAAVLAQHNKVYAYDISKEKVNLIKEKKIPFIDKELNEYLSLKRLNIIPTLDFNEAYKKSEIVIIATPTNLNSETNKFDASSVELIIKDVIAINPKAWIIIKSTVGVGFTKYVIEKYKYDKILFSPEFLREGKALYDNLYPSRIVVGAPKIEKKYLLKAKQFALLLKQGALKENININIADSSEAEAIKLFSNAYLAMRVAYFNELDSFAKDKDLNASNIIKGVCDDPRIGDFYNNPSFGYGGYCLPKDIKELKADYGDIPQEIISSVISSNEARKNFITGEILKTLKPNDIVGIFRLIMKYESDNYRQSSVIDIIKKLLSKNINVIIFEPSIDNDSFMNCIVYNDLAKFKEKSSIIVANRYNSSLDDVKEKVFTRDLFKRD